MRQRGGESGSLTASKPLTQLMQERDDHLAQALGLFKRKAVACVLNLFDSQAWVEQAPLPIKPWSRTTGGLAPPVRR